MDQIQTINELLLMARRRMSVWGSVVALGFVVSVLYAFSLPREYESTAVIQIGNSQISDSIKETDSTSSLTRYLQKIEQRIMARDNLVGVIEVYDLFGNVPTMTMNDKVFQLRLATKIVQISDPTQNWRPDNAPSAMRVTVRLGGPKIAASVANDFVNRVLEENRLARVEQAQRALAFFDSEEARVDAAITALDAKIAEFKRENAESLPQKLVAQHELLVGLEEAVLAIDQQIIELKSNKAKTRASEYETQLALAQAQRQLIFDRQARIREAIADAPQVEKEFNILNRQLTQLEDQYTVITQNRAEAEIGQMLETGIQSENLVVLEKALVPEHPIAPNRKKLTAVGTMLSIIAAAALVLLLEALNPAIRNAAQLERQLQMSPVVTIPDMKSGAPRTRQRNVLAVCSVLSVGAIWAGVQMISGSGS
ncbi:MAG: chain-length determining protein [Rhodobacteraceae bacterium]|nr:chain-length determining protein [Paracoccaceae bacterium]